MDWRTQLSLLNMLLLLTGLVFSPPLLSIGLIGICVLGILDLPAVMNPSWRAKAAEGLRDPFNWAFAMLYLVLLFGFWQTEDWGYYFERLRIKLALLTVPIGWWGLPRWTKQQQHFLLAFFVGLLTLVALAVLANYLLHFEAIQAAIASGQAMPVPRNHIRFSLLVAIATFCSLELWRHHSFGKARLWLGIALFLFLFQHILAVRSGLVGAYVGLLAVLILFLRQAAYRKYTLPLLTVLLLSPFLAYQSIPSLQKKINYVGYEIWLQQAGHNTTAFSDAGRFSSIRLGLLLWQEQPWLGVGPGNLRQAMDQAYAAHYPDMEARRPHNQFVSVLAGSGLLGFIPFTLAFFYLLVGRKRWQQPLYLSVFTLLFASCLVENTLENSTGIGIFCFFIYFLGQVYENESPLSRHKAYSDATE